MKIVVYAISKNESKFVKRWYESMKEADEIYVLDTGSTDDTVKLLEDLGVKVTKKIINPFRFDVARNLSLDLVPGDTTLCVCTDLDEVFLPGWRKLLENNYRGETRIGYTYNWHLKDGKPDVSFILDKIHTRFDYKWTHPVHEVLENINNNEKRKNILEITLNHFPDPTKSRSNYLRIEYIYYQKYI